MGVAYGGKSRYNYVALKGFLIFFFLQGWHKDLCNDSCQLGFRAYLYHCGFRGVVLGWNSEPSFQARDCWWIQIFRLAERNCFPMFRVNTSKYFFSLDDPKSSFKSRKKTHDYEQVIVTPHVNVNLTQSQLNEDNDDFSSRRRYHQTGAVTGQLIEDT